MNVCGKFVHHNFYKESLIRRSMDLSILEKAGLTKNEISIYQTLLKHGSKTATSISKNTGLHRRIVYDSLYRLIQKGIVSYILQNKKRIFQATNPQRFLEIIEEEKQSLNSIMPSMLELFNSKKETSSETQFFKGIEGLKSIFEDELRAKKEILIIGANEIAYELMELYFYWFDKKRIKEKIKTKIIFNKTFQKYNIPLSEIKYLPEKYSSNMAINIYGDKIAIILWNKENPIAILIKESELAEAYKKHFEIMWRIAKK